MGNSQYGELGADSGAKRTKFEPVEPFAFDHKVKFCSMQGWFFIIVVQENNHDQIYAIGENVCLCKFIYFFKKPFGQLSGQRLGLKTTTFVKLDCTPLNGESIKFMCSGTNHILVATGNDEHLLMPCRCQSSIYNGVQQ